MRARLALKSSRTDVRLREIVLRDKPDEFLKVSAKATVPVLVLEDGTVLEESRDIMFWALHHQDPEGWLKIYLDDPVKCKTFLDRLDGPFKTHLDRYKYASRYGDGKAEAETHRREGAAFLNEIDSRLSRAACLSGDTAGLLDFAALPFVRQFRGVDADWFDRQDWPHLHPWLQDFLNSERFATIMEKYRPWRETGGEGIPF
jgi:glutathione S-transferase